MENKDFRKTADAIVDKEGLDLYHSSGIRNAIANSLDLAYRMGIQECWDAVHSKIESGPLSGNGFDKTAERNGLILACNIIAKQASN